MKYLSALVFGLLLMAFAVAPLYVVKPPASKAVAESTPRLVRYSFTLSNQTNQSIEHAVFKTFAPVKETAYQKVEWIRANEEFELREDSWGNQELEFLVQNLPPYGQKVITVTAQLQMWGQPRPWDKYRNISVGLDPIVEPSLPALQQALLEISHDPKAEVALDWIQKANSWVSKHLEDVGYVSEDRGALYALTERKGDCTEFMHTLVALGRANQVPSLPVAGFRLEGQNAILKAVDYHNWVLFHANNAWRLADPHSGLFEQQQSNYVAFRVFHDESDRARNSQRFFVHDARMKVLMN